MSGAGLPPQAPLIPLLEIKPRSFDEGPPPRFPDIVEGYLPAGGTHIFAGPQNVGKTAFMAWMLAELGARGAFLGHKGHLPPWVRLFVFDREHSDWAYWAETAGIECPQGYWVLNDSGLSIATIRGWKGYQKAIDFWEARVRAMNPEPGGLIITDGGLDLVGDGTTKYFDAYANMVAVQRITRELQLTHILICHAGKPKALGSKDAKARDLDKANMSAGGLGAADTLAYLSCAEELVESGGSVPDYQRFTWVPHHAKAEELELGRTEKGLFCPYVPPQDTVEAREARTKKERERSVDGQRVKFVLEILAGAEGGRLLAAEVAQMLQGKRFGFSQSVAYRVISLAKEWGVARAEGRDLILVEGATARASTGAPSAISSILDKGEPGV